MAGTLGLGAKPLPERMVVSVEPGLGRLPLMRLRTLALYVDGLIDVHPDAFRPLDTKAQRIGARQRRIEGQEDRLAVGAGDLRLDDVPEREPDLRVGVSGAGLVDDIIMEAARMEGVDRSDKRREGTGGVSECRVRWGPWNKTTKQE